LSDIAEEDVENPEDEKVDSNKSDLGDDDIPSNLPSESNLA
jgi:hypothetical protein